MQRDIAQKRITEQKTEESHLALVTEYSESRDKEIPFVENGHSALFSITR